MLKLYHQDELLGTITEVSQVGSEMIGTIELTPAAAKFMEVWEYVKDSTRLMSGEEPPFDGDLYFDHWFVEDQTGKRDEIIVPGIHDQKSIRWLYC